MEQEHEDNLEEFEKEFTQEEFSPLYILGAFLIVAGCAGLIILWVTVLLESLRH